MNAPAALAAGTAWRAPIALYGHGVFAQGTIWGIDSFGQRGVECGEELALASYAEITGTAAQPSRHDSATAALIGRYRARREAAAGRGAPVTCGATVEGTARRALQERS